MNKKTIKNMENTIRLSNIMNNEEWFKVTFFNATMRMTNGKRCVELSDEECAERLNLIIRNLEIKGYPITRGAVLDRINAMATLFLIFS